MEHFAKKNVLGKSLLEFVRLVKDYGTEVLTLSPLFFLFEPSVLRVHLMGRNCLFPCPDESHGGTCQARI